MNYLRKQRRKISKKYPERFVQDIDFIEISNPKWKYQMICDRSIQTSLYGSEVVTPYFALYKDGRLFIFSGYAWDGVTGFPDLPSMMRASCGHDVVFQMLREGLISDSKREYAFKTSNKDLATISKIDGLMWPFYIMVNKAVDMFGYKFARKVVK
jgi:hypothetical protein